MSQSPTPAFAPECLATLHSVVARILPGTDGPGAANTAAAVGVERALSHRALRGLRPGIEQMLDQLDADAAERHGVAFSGCTADEQDDLLRALEQDQVTGARFLFRVLIAFSLEGLLGDPLHGGNRDFLGWQAIGLQAADVRSGVLSRREAGLMAMIHDAVVIGSGAGGGPLAARLAEAGWKVLLLEKGPWRQRDDYSSDEVTATQRDFFVPSFTDEPHVLVPADDPWPRPTHLGWIGNSVGGGTVRMGGFFYRFHPDDFRMASRYGRYEGLADWPYDYDELEPYYTIAEWDCGISGAAGTNPFEGGRSAPYPLPPVDAHPLTACLEQACRRLGWHPFPTPRAIASRPYRGRPACSYCGACPGFGCHTGAKSSVQETYIARALATGNCELRPDAMVREITVDQCGLASGCTYLDSHGAEHAVRARIVCVSCSSVESARLLLLSKSPRFPDGLANGSGLVGRHLQFHGFSNGRGQFRYDQHADKPLRHPNPFLECSLADHYFLPEGISDLPKGGVIRFGFPAATPIAAALRAAEEGPDLLWGSRLERRLHEYFHDYLTVDFEVFHDFIPNDGTFVTLDPQVRDKWGMPSARIHLDVPDHHRVAGRWLVERGLEAFTAMGADAVFSEEIGETAPYLVHGTCRAGHDPAQAVLDQYCRAHEVRNLFVVDGSFMPTSGGAPPTLTIIANSLRTADHILASAKGGGL